MMRRSMPILLISIGLLCATQCDPGKFSLFPHFLTSVTHTANAGNYFQHMAGERFFFYSMRADMLNTDFLYVIQVSPAGARRLAVYNGVLQPVTTLDTVDWPGNMHVRI